MSPIKGVPPTTYLKTKDVKALTTAPLRAVDRVRIDASQEDLFAFVADTEKLLDWMPGLEAIKSLDHAKSQSPGEMGVGSVRSLKFGFTDVERIELWEPPRGYAYAIVDGAPVRDHLAVITVEPDLMGQGSVFTWYQYFNVKRLSIGGWFMPGRVPSFIESATDNLISKFGGERVSIDELRGSDFNDFGE